jgi:hypothetical protein
MAVTFPVSTPASVPAVTPIPLRTLGPWALLVGLIALALLYFVGAEEGATALFAGTGIHEFVHDGRHLLGFPCH